MAAVARDLTQPSASRDAPGVSCEPAAFLVPPLLFSFAWKKTKIIYYAPVLCVFRALLGNATSGPSQRQPCWGQMGAGPGLCSQARHCPGDVMGSVHLRLKRRHVPAVVSAGCPRPSPVPDRSAVRGSHTPAVTFRRTGDKAPRQTPLASRQPPRLCSLTSSRPSRLCAEASLALVGGSRAGWGGDGGAGGGPWSVEPGELVRVPARSALVGLRPSLLNAGRLDWQAGGLVTCEDSFGGTKGGSRLPWVEGDGRWGGG